ncbi:Acetamidase/Formamidase, partial [Gonapodya prolifera JEL478]
MASEAIPGRYPLSSPVYVPGIKNAASWGQKSPLIPEGLRTIVKLDPSIPCFHQDQPQPFHNRFHPEIPPVATVEVGETVRLESFDATGGQMKPTLDDASDCTAYDSLLTHVMSGPIFVQGAQPGDAIEVEIIEMDVISGLEWGYTGVPGSVTGFLADHFPTPAKAIWDLSSHTHATSPHIPHIKVPRMFHLGIVATAPSQEILDNINEREKRLWGDTGGDTATPVVACLPDERLALVGGAAKLGSDALDRIRKTALRTIPPRPEIGGNLDIRELGPGSKIILPVHVEGANLSLADPHFCEGEGEVSGMAVECAGQVAFRVSRIIKQGMKSLMYKSPLFIPNPAFVAGPPSLMSDYLSFSGFSVHRGHSHVQHNADVTLAFRNALLAAITFLTAAPYFYSREQALIILSATPISSRISCVVDIPNACVTVWIPRKIF